MGVSSPARRRRQLRASARHARRAKDTCAHLRARGLGMHYARRAQGPSTTARGCCGARHGDSARHAHTEPESHGPARAARGALAAAGSSSTAGCGWARKARAGGPSPHPSHTGRRRPAETDGQTRAPLWQRRPALRPLGAATHAGATTQPTLHTRPTASAADQPRTTAAVPSPTGAGQRQGGAQRENCAGRPARSWASAWLP
jgi:hypothetical protein